MIYGKSTKREKVEKDKALVKSTCDGLATWSRGVCWALPEGPVLMDPLGARAGGDRQGRGVLAESQTHQAPQTQQRFHRNKTTKGRSGPTSRGPGS